MQALSLYSCIAVVVAALAPQTLRNITSIACAMTAMTRCCCVACVVLVLATQASLWPSLSLLVGQWRQQTPLRQQRWPSHQYPWPEGKGQHDPTAWRNKNKNKNKNSATTTACVACTMTIGGPHFESHLFIFRTKKTSSTSLTAFTPGKVSESKSSYLSPPHNGNAPSPYPCTLDPPLARGNQ